MVISANLKVGRIFRPRIVLCAGPHVEVCRSCGMRAARRVVEGDIPLFDDGECYSLK